VRHLALLYAKGHGVDRDPIVACALANLSNMATNRVPFDAGPDPLAYKARLHDSEAFVRAHCGQLSQHEERLSGKVFGCLAFEIPPPTLVVGSMTIWLALESVSVVEAAEPSLVATLGCYSTIARLRSLTLEPPPDAAPGVAPRHFLEAFVWEGSLHGPAASVTYFLTLRMFELRNRKVDLVAEERLLSVDGWPRSALPFGFDARFSVEMIRSGHVRWRRDGAPPTSGWIMLPEGQSR
jgi:hypothetical protein